MTKLATKTLFSNTLILGKMIHSILRQRIAVLFFLCIVGILHTNAQEYVPFTPRLAGGNVEVRGDIIFVGNNILNRASEVNPSQANTPYNGTANNNSLWMEYIDIDSDPSTFSSSSAELNVADPSCSQVRYAGLYWAGTYPNERSTDGGAQFNGTPRIEEWNEIKFRVPGGAYVDLVADNNPDAVGQEDDIIMNGYDPSNPTTFVKDAPVICYKNITDLVRSNPNPNGEYTAANIRATRGTRNGSSSAGWVMVIIYENPNESGKFISTFDGYASLSGSVGNVDVNVNGFRTLPTPFNVNARIGVAALEGDRGISGDRFFIEGNSSGNGFTNLNTGLNPSNNFFNSTITTDGNEVPTRTPYGTNTLGTDIDLFDLNNQFNNILPNDETGATLRFTSSGDGYGPFLTVFTVEIIEPNIILEKRVNTPGGVDITGQGVNLGQTLDYVLSFQNIGNDDGADYTIRDVLPLNVSPPDGRTDFIPTDFDLPPGVTYVYNSTTKEVIFSIPNDLVQENDPAYSLRIRVQVAENCFDFINACSDLIQNLAYSTYRGVQNSAQITDDPSVTDFNACGFTVPGATNFLLDDLADCNFQRTVELCGSSAVLNAGDGFDSYVWVRDDNGNGELDITDTVINDGDPDNDPSTIVVAQEGTYIVDKIVADPCKGFKEIITVVPYGSGTIPNPIIEFFNTVNGDSDPANDITGEIVQCSVDNDLLPKIFLCGINDTKLLQVNILDSQSIVWEKLDEGSCSASGDDCANKALTCTWSQVGTGNNYTVNSEGQYRLSITYQNGCTSRFYYNVFQNNLDIQYNKEDIVCNSPGNITITNLGNGYGYQLVDAADNSIVVPFSANNGPSFDFNSGQNGAYIVEVTQLDISGNPIENACVFNTPIIGVLDRNITYDVTANDVDCNGLGSIGIQINNANANYEYELRLDDGTNGGLGTLIDNETAQPDNNFEFTGLNAGEYIVVARTDDGCSYSEQITVNNLNTLTLNARVSQHITCREGNIIMNSDGGKTPHTYAIWSFVDNNGSTVTSYTTPQEMPSSEFQTSQIFDILDPGDYTFVVVDRNNCFSFSNTVTIEFRPAAEFNPTSVIDVACFGDSSGTIQFNLIDDNGYQLTYYLFDNTTFDESNYDYVNALATNRSGYFPNLSSGDYAIVIAQRKGSASCDYSEFHTISAPSDALSATSVLIQDYTCIQDAIIEAQNVTGGTAPYAYSIDGVNFITDSTPNAHRFENITPGNYTLTVRDANNCVVLTDPILIEDTNPPSDINVVESQITCPAQTVNLQVTAVDGTAPFVFEIIAPTSISPNATSGNTADFNNLTSNTYTIRVTDVDGCFYEENYTIAPIVPITISASTVQAVSCFGFADGTVQFNINYQAGQNFTHTVTGPSGPVSTGGVQSTINLPNLLAGDYTLDIVDTDTNCTYSTTYTLEGPPSALAVASPSVTQSTCLNDGRVLMSATGGWGSYEYTLVNPDSSPFGTNINGSFNGLTQGGTYTGTVTDANNCVVPFTFDLTAATIPVLQLIPSNVCYDDAVGLTITANVTSGGDGNFEYNINGGAYSASNTFSGLAPGTYTVNVRDGNSCTDTQTLTINPELSVIASAGNITACATDTNIDITAAGGDGNYVYAVVGDGVAPTTGDFSTTNSVNAIASGDYDVYVRDNNGNAGYCEVSYDITISQEAPVSAIPTVVDVNCFGASNGSIQLVASGGEAPYTYSIDGGSSFTTANTFNNLLASTYDVRIRDSNNCETPLIVTVNEPAQIVAEALQTEDYTCLQVGEIAVGSITSTSGGSGNYQYSINGGAWTASTAGGTVFTDLIDGTYVIQVRDANNINCFIALPAIIIAPLQLEPNLSSTVTYNCDGTGNITIVPNDPTYTYSLNGSAPQVSNLFPNVNIGSNTITVNYGSECTKEIDVEVQPGNAFEASLVSSADVACNGDNTGSITFDVDNFGTGGFEYSLDNFTTTLGSSTTSPQTISSLTAGNYTISIRDVDNPIAGCTVTLNQTINEPTPVVTSASITEQFLCTNAGAMITASATGGTPTYEYQLEDTLGGIITAYQTGTTFTSVPAGDYVVRARDTNGCLDAIDTVITVVAPITPTFTLTATACYTGNNDGSIQVDVTDGNGLYQFSINGGPWLTPSPNTATIYTFSNLGNGTYTIDVRDSFGCPAAQQSVTLDPLLSAIVDVTDVSSCSDGSISVTASGGDGNYAYAFVPTTTSPTGLFGPTNTFVVTPGNAGTYDVYVRDNAGGTPFCEYLETVTVNPAVALTFTATPTDPLCHDGVGTIEVNVTSGDNPYTLQIIDLDNGGASDQTLNNILNPTTTFYNLAPGNYTINVTDSNGCTVSQTPITINNPDELAADIMAILPSACASVNPNDFGFQFINYPTTLGTIEFSADGGSTWVADNSVPGTSDIITGYVSGSSVYPSIRTVDGLGNTICQLDLPRYIIPYPLDDLDISISTVVVNCNELRVTVQGTEGVAPYEYAFTDDPANFNPAAAIWNPGGSFDNLGNPVTAGHGMYQWAGLIPGRTYIFYVRDSSGCIRQSNVNVNDITTNPLEIDAAYEPSCSGANDGTITYTITDTDGNIEPNMRWEFYDITGGLVQSSGGNIPFSTSITVSGVAPDEYYIVVTEVDAGGVDNCISGSENLIIDELDPITAILNKLSDISCNAPGLIAIENIQGGGGDYTYTVTGPAPFVTIMGTPDNPVEIPVNSVAGPYNVTITDQYGCSTDLGTVVLDLSPNPTIDSMVVDNCASPTSLTINASSSAAQILYSIDGGTTYVDNGGVFNNLAPGSYNVAIIDSNGCTDTDVIDVYPVLEANVSLTKLLDCSISPDAEITIDVNFGSGNYDYEISNGLGSVVARTNLPSTPYVFSTTVPEDYTITIYDNGTSTPECNRVFTVTVPPAILPVLSITSYTDVSCNGADDGIIRVSATDGGISPYTFEIISGPGSGASLPIAPISNTVTTATFESLAGLVAPGITYTIRATAANGCTTDITQVITQPEPITNVNASVTEFICTVGNNENNATITIDGAAIIGGSGNYVRYEFVKEDDPNTAAVEAPVVVQSGTNPVYTETNTAGGSYTINVYDSNGCIGTTTAIIAPFDELISAAVAITNTVTCNPGNDGELTMNVVSSLGDPSRFVYSIDNGSNYQASNIFGGLSAGPYTILARHIDTGCIISASETLLEPNTFTINVTKTSDVICYGTTTGAVNFGLVDATYPGGFTWTIYDTNGTLADTSDDLFVISNTEATNGPTADTNLPAGSYYVSISQDNNPFCVNIESFTIAGPPAAITGAVNTADITCVPGNDGAIEIINVAGGWGGYTYYIGVAAPSAPSDYLASPSLGGLSAGTYQAWVRDAQGCEQLIDNNIVLADPTPISASLLVNQENCTNLEGEIEVVVVTGGQGSNYTYQLILNGSNFRTSQNTPVFSGLGAGSYEVEVTDQWGCTFTTSAELLYEEMNLTTTVVKSIDCTVNPGGEITVNVTGSSTNLEFEMTTPLGSVVTQPSGIFTNLNEVGTYNFIVRDLDTTNPVCEKPISQELVAPITPVLLNATIINVSCNGGSDGSLTATLDPATDGNPDYQYVLIGVSAGAPSRPLQSNPLFDNLPAGQYQVRVVSGLGCEDVKSESITEPEPLVISATATTFDCAADNSINTATITVNIEDGAATPGILSGTGPYLYSLDNINYQSANTFSIADNGMVQNITVYARDANGCPATDTVTIQPINRFTAMVAMDVEINCNNNAETVIITVLDNGLTHNYTYELLPIGNTNAVQTGSTANSATFDLIATGSYTFRVTDTDTGCYYDTPAYNVEPYDYIRATATAATPVTCFGDSNGEIQINITGYIGNYDYQIFDAAGNPIGGVVSTDTSFNPRVVGGLSGGNYYVTITETDVPFCSEDTNMVTIASPDMALTAIVNPLSEATCSDDQGEIVIDPSGGYAPYDISMVNTITGDIYTATDVQAISFAGLSAGNFEITVTDASGCVYTDIEVLNPATPIIANTTPLITDLACYGDTGATVTANVIGGGSGSYEYQLNYYDDGGTTITFTTGQQLSPNFNDLGAGIYSITVSDGWNCDMTTNTVEITEPTLVEAFLIRTDPLTCATGAEFELTATGGSGSYEYSVDNLTFLPMTSNPLALPETGVLPAGTYQYYVRDAVNGCDAVVSNAITEDPIIPLSLVVDSSAAFINCTGEGTAAIYAQADGGLGNYQYELFTDVSLSIGSRIAGPQPNGVFRNLTAGTYYVSVTSEDCTTLPEEVIITEPTPLSYTEEIINITCAGENNGQITVTLSGGAGGYQYAISPNLNQFDTVNTFTELSPGNYTIIAQDQNGCFEYLTFTITEPTVLDVNATVTPEICIDSQDGSIILEITGGTAPYSAALNSNDDADFVQDRTEFFDMATGNYLLFIRDANGCETNLVVDVERGVNLNATVEPIYECTGNVPNNYLNITLEDESVIGDVLYALDSADPADLQLNPDFRNSTPGNHYITIAHANGCIQTIDFVIEAFEPLTLSLEQLNLNEITANAGGGREEYTYFFDGINNGNDNTFYITRTDTFEVRVVDENGCEAVANIFIEFIDIEIPNFFTPDGDGQNDLWIPRNMEQFPEILIKIFDRYGRVVSAQSYDSQGWDGKYHGNEMPTGDYWYVVKLNGESDEREFVGHFTLYR